VCFEMIDFFRYSGAGSSPWGEQKNFFSRIQFFFSKTCRARRDESFGVTFRVFGDGRLCKSFSVGPSPGGK
jgi:hypothetical protein